VGKRGQRHKLRKRFITDSKGDGKNKTRLLGQKKREKDKSSVAKGNVAIKQTGAGGWGGTKAGFLKKGKSSCDFKGSETRKKKREVHDTKSRETEEKNVAGRGKRG